MERYPRRLYFAASWRGISEQLTERVAASLAKAGFTLLGDHKVHRAEETGRGLHWQQRVDDVVLDCCGLVAVLPPDGTSQSTTPFMIPELMIAARQGIPLLIVAAPGVNIEITEEGGSQILWLPKPARRTVQLLARPAASYPACTDGSVRLLELEATLSDDALMDIAKLDLSNCSSVIGPVSYIGEASDRELDSAIGSFVNALNDRVSKTVFHIVPFCRKSLHSRVAAAVFEETGLPCVIASDQWRAPVAAREHWRQLLGESELVIADLSESNRNCLFEAGVAAGLSKKMLIVRSGGKRQSVEMPFGLDDYLYSEFGSESELEDEVRRFCLPYKRTVFNLSVMGAGVEVPSGVPDWYGEVAPGGFGERSMRLQAILLSLLAVLLLGSALYLARPEYVAPFATLVAGPIVALTLVARFLDSAKADLNDWFVARARGVRNVAAVLTVAGLIAVMAAWFLGGEGE